MKQRRITTDWDTLDSIDPICEVNGSLDRSYRVNRRRPLARLKDIAIEGPERLTLRYSRRLRSIFSKIRRIQG